MAQVLARRAALAAAASVLALLLAELVVRFALPEYADSEECLRRLGVRVVNSAVAVTPTSDRYDERFGFRFSPNASREFETAEFRYTARTNALGFRGREMTPRQPGEYRVMLLGDSMFWGVGCPEGQTIDAQLEQLGQGHGTVAFNFATPGYNTVQELLVARAFLADADPDHVVLGLFTANDPLATWLADIDPAGRYVVAEERLGAFHQELRERVGPVLWRSATARMVASTLWAPKWRYEIAGWDAVVERTRGVLRELAVLCEKENARLSIVLMYPADAYVNGRLQAWTNSRDAGRRYARALAEDGFDVLDTLEPLSRDDAGELFYPRDGHLNPQGTLALAKIVYEQALAPRR